MSDDYHTPRSDDEQPSRGLSESSLDDETRSRECSDDDNDARDSIGDDAARPLDDDTRSDISVSRRATLAAGVGTALGVSGCLGISLDGGGTADGGETAPRESETTTEPQTTTGAGSDTPTANTTTASTTTADGTTRAVTVRLPRAPAGVQKFAFTVSHDSVSLSDVFPGAIDGEEFQVVEGGSGSRQVRVRGADLSQSVQDRSDPVALFTLTFAAAVDPERLSVAAETLVADDGSSLTEQWTLRATTPPE